MLFLVLQHREHLGSWNNIWKTWLDGFFPQQILQKENEIEIPLRKCIILFASSILVSSFFRNYNIYLTLAYAPVN